MPASFRQFIRTRFFRMVSVRSSITYTMIEHAEKGGLSENIRKKKSSAHQHQHFARGILAPALCLPPKLF
jgi:hypothetical protein